MESHDPNQPERSDEEPTREEPTREEPAGGGPPPPRRLYRSRSDRLIGGVCGGLGHYFGIDPIIVRVAAVVLLLFGGAGALAYLAFLVLVPNEPAEGAPPATTDRSRAATIVAVVALIVIGGPLLLLGGVAVAGVLPPLAILALAGLLVWWLVSGEGPGGGAGDVVRRAALGLGVLLLCLLIFAGGGWAAGVGGGAVAAGVVIAAGLALLVSAFAGGLRLLILPALSLALGVGFVSAADIDLHGGVGQREYRPASASDLRDRYQIGMGQLVVDLRGADLPKGDTRLKMKIGIGDALVLVPRDVCVASSADVGAGAVNVFNRDSGGVDVNWDDRPRARAETSRVIVDADVGVGAFEVHHDRQHGFRGHGGRWHDGGNNGSSERNEGCLPGGASA
jgi:phage shock protein PspC (stress-responsive transcriptional regulator)